MLVSEGSLDSKSEPRWLEEQLRKQALLPADIARQLLRYNPETGELARKHGKPFKARTPNGYIVCGIGGFQYSAHRLAWLMHYGRWPAEEIDHINRVKDDNRIANLREVPRMENMFNVPRTRSAAPAAKQPPTSPRVERAERVNALLQTIAACGRRFFSSKQEDENGGTYRRVSRFTVVRGLPYFWDHWSDKRIMPSAGNCEWKGFSEGGTLRALVTALDAWIRTGEPIKGHLGPWPEWVNGGDPWGYGADMEQVRAKARELGILA